ncbi:MAG: glycosyltransferase family 2 protein [Bacteroidales bacterium]|nr:glycosyltransferase family 2 protein [Bacteroidales bacterium]
MDRYRISLIAPIYGVEKYIARFAESVLDQTYQDIQFVFVNDGTKDRSMDILRQLIDERYVHLKPRILIIDKENGGLPSARKAGLDAAEGEYILFADSDDWLQTDAVEKVMAKADETDADIVYFDLIKEYGNRVSYKKEREYTGETKEDFIVNMFNYKSFGYTVTKCFKRKLYTDNVIYMPKLGMHEDIYLMSQIIFYAGSLVHIPEALYHYRKDNPDSFCAQDRHKRHIASTTNLLDLYEHYRNNLKGSPIEKVAGSILMRAGQHSIMHGYDFFEKYPYLAGDLRKTRISFRYRTAVPMQIIVKIYSLFR